MLAGGGPGASDVLKKKEIILVPRSAWQRLLGVALAREDLSAKVSTK